MSAWLPVSSFRTGSFGMVALAVAAGGGVGVAACSAGGDGGGALPGQITPEPGTGGAPGVTPTGTTPPVIVTPEPTGTADPNDNRDIPIREEICVDGVCVCLRVALLGTLDSAANNANTQPFIDWLNGNSGGSAFVTMVSTKPTIDATWLGDYDVLIVANVNGWTFSEAEKAAVQEWVLTRGGGIISTTGYVSTATEPAVSSQLIEFSGVKYNSTTTASDSGAQNTPVYFGDGTTDLKNCLAWTGSSDAIITAAVPFVPQTGSLEKLTFSVRYVGAFFGFGIDAPPDATVVATDPVSGANIAVAKEVEGKGRVFAWGDEWVSLASLWAPVGSAPNQQKDQYNICYVPASGEEPEYFHSVATLYQAKQFWYNAINWVAPPNMCNFVIEDPEVVIIR